MLADLEGGRDVDVVGLGAGGLGDLDLLGAKGWEGRVGAVEGEGAGQVDGDVDLDGLVEAGREPGGGSAMHLSATVPRAQLT